LYTWLTFDWWYDALEPRRRRQQLGVMRGLDQRRQYFSLMLGEEFHHRLGVLGSAYHELVACRFDPKSCLSRSAQEG